jgi:hypothetical protein
LCDVCFASKKSSEREFFIPAGTHLAVKLLRVFDPPRLAPYHGGRMRPHE